MLIFTLKRQWYELIKSGQKTHEYRYCNPYWITRITNFQNRTTDNICYFQLGYDPKTRLKARILSIEMIDENCTPFAVNGPVYDIWFELL